MSETPQPQTDVNQAMLPGEEAISQEFSLPYELRVDKDNVEHLHFQVAPGVSFTFRGREDVPLELPEAKPTVSHVLSLDERPLHTSGDSFGYWLSEKTNADPLTDPFERAANRGEDVEFVASSTPLGVIDAAIKLTELGVGEVSKSADLKRIRDKIQARQFDGQVTEVFDDLVAAGLVDDEAQAICVQSDRNWPKADAPMLVAMALAGDRAAADKLARRMAILKLADEQLAAQRAAADGYDQSRPSGDKLSPDEIEQVKRKHFVGVHTTVAEPFFVDGKPGGVSVIRPTGEYHTNSSKQVPRNTIHWSLNHPVTSHLMGQFERRPYTVVSPMEDLMQANGAPAVLYGVDSYFSVNPGEGMLIPPSATIIETDAKQEQFIQRQENVISLRGGELKAEDLDELMQFMQNNFPEMCTYEGRFNAFSIYNSLMSADGLLDYMYRLKDLQYDEAKLATMYESLPQKLFLRELRDVDALLRAAATDLRVEYELSDPSGFGQKDYGRLMNHAIDMLFHGDVDIKDYPAFQPVLAESVRQMIVKALIVKHGGKVVKSDGMSAYIEDGEFTHDVAEVAQTLQVRSGLHQHQSEYHLESSYSSAMSKAAVRHEVPESIRADLTNAPHEVVTDFDWTKYDSRPIWSTLRNATWQTRRVAASMGILTYDKKQITSSSSLMD